jgi:hypothetical protein
LSSAPEDGAGALSDIAGSFDTVAASDFFALLLSFGALLTMGVDTLLAGSEVSCGLLDDVVPLHPDAPTRLNAITNDIRAADILFCFKIIPPLLI